MKKKVIFMIINMNIGGTERALLNMITEMPEDKYDITVLMLEEYGGFLDSIPTNVQKMYMNGYQDIKEIIHQPPREIIIKHLKKGQIFKSLRLLYKYSISKLFNNHSVLYKDLLKGIPKISKEYDIAIAYAGPMDFISYYVIHGITAKRKIQWIHFDVSKIGFNQNFAANIYRNFHQIYVVSEEGKNKLINKLPSLENKIKTFLNIISPKTLEQMSVAGDGFTDKFNGIRILTVGRLSKEKGQDLAIQVLAQLKKDGYNVKWYCVGDGNAKETYKQLISEYGVENDFILLGSKTNPYPYMKQCDIYVQPSRHEGYCITLAEAKHFRRPIVCTNFTGANEQILDGETGMVVDLNETEIIKGIETMINNKQLRNKFIYNLSKENQKKPEDAFIS